MPITGKQVRQLRSMANPLKPLLIIGKEGVGANTAKQADEALEKHELIKCSVLESCPQTAQEAGRDLAERVEAELVQVIGRKFVLYRETSREDVEKIQLV